MDETSLHRNSADAHCSLIETPCSEENCRSILLSRTLGVIDPPSSASAVVLCIADNGLNLGTDTSTNPSLIESRPVVQPVIDVRAVLFTVADGTLLLALEERADDRRLPRGEPLLSETLDSAAQRIVRDTIGVHEQYLEQLYTLSEREHDRWDVIVSYMALIASHHAPTLAAGARWHDVEQLPPLATADRLVADYALVRLRAKLGYTNVAFHLMPDTFTLTELQNAYETILGRPLDKRNFRRRVTASGILATTTEKRRDGSHRPAALYRFRAEHDPATYLTPPWAGDA